MNTYVDSSVLLRVILGEPDRLTTWTRISTPVSSELIRLECLRTIDRARVRLHLNDEAIATRRSAALEMIDSLRLVSIDRLVLERAAEPFPTSIGSLDAIHLASALFAREQMQDLVLATHDAELGLAARAVGFTVHGLASTHKLNP
ncbi:MAG: type II toxin-antitoxin system VapC family toxin [Actinomycetota bacterium]|nr:type II toxin-antitoxin system VapC family toxin [Actinomycetota bacterium]